MIKSFRGGGGGGSERCLKWDGAGSLRDLSGGNQLSEAEALGHFKPLPLFVYCPDHFNSSFYSPLYDCLSLQVANDCAVPWTPCYMLSMMLAIP